MALVYRRKSSKVSDKSKSHDMVSIWNFDGKIAFQDILNATECFDDKYRIGTGGYRDMWLYRTRYALVLYYHINPFDFAELSSTMVFTDKCDVYSFGVLTMEVVMEQHTKLKDILDHRIVVPTSDEEKDIILLMLVAFACLQICPKARRTMQQAYQALTNRSCPTVILRLIHEVKLQDLHDFEAPYKLYDGL
ncbi:unnamed protein product [Miscanthus lutarioriparius]|uniref:non-specific serine/threonine protein kinase n=1 Tax=Miscanthus lutarioriparius TaxID=422564 RepID=A0A811P8I1_9POAL|nr:unnamed protein product [Miscanthus lutarioriparius]